MRMEIADDPHSHRLTLVKIDPSWIQLQSGIRINIFHNVFKKKSIDWYLNPWHFHKSKAITTKSIIY